VKYLFIFSNPHTQFVLILERINILKIILSIFKCKFSSFSNLFSENKNQFLASLFSLIQVCSLFVLTLLMLLLGNIYSLFLVYLISEISFFNPIKAQAIKIHKLNPKS